MYEENKNLKYEKKDKIIEIWNKSKNNLDFSNEVKNNLENIFFTIQKEFDNLSKRISFITNSVRIIKENEYEELRLKIKEKYKYTNENGEEQFLNYKDAIQKLETLAKEAKTNNYPVLKIDEKSFIMDIDKINKVIITPGEYTVRVVGIYWDPLTNISKNRSIRLILETETHDLLYVPIFKNREFDYYAPTKQNNIELKSTDMWLKILKVKIGVNKTTTFLELEEVSESEKQWVHVI